MESVINKEEEVILTLKNELGLHARPADLFVRCANSFGCSISIYNQTRNASKKVNAKSILGVLSIGVRGSDTVRIVAAGDDSKQAIAALTQLIESNFEEETK